LFSVGHFDVRKVAAMSGINASVKWYQSTIDDCIAKTGLNPETHTIGEWKNRFVIPT
jgi:hypothetical protein